MPGPHLPCPTVPRAWRRAFALVAMGVQVAAGATTCEVERWPLWEDFQARFIQADGRVVDASTPQRHTSSEGQSYGMFFALVAGDRATFDRLWKWTEANLAGGDISKRLPAWFWGQAPDGTWRVIDANAAADADLWLTYDLLEAARLWGRQEYAARALDLLARIETEEVAELPGLGKMLLPAPMGFTLPGSIWRLNASYLPPPVLRRLATASPHGGWREIARNTPAVYGAGPDTGYVADWVAYVAPAPSAAKPSPRGRFATDPVKGDVGSYDAIRTYLWAGMTPNDDPLAAPLREATRGLATATAVLGHPPEYVRTATGVTDGTGPFGFSAALLPYLQVTDRTELLNTQRVRVQTLLEQARAKADATNTQPPYYDYVLTLFGQGWSEGRYRFRAAGTVQPSWEKSCAPISAQSVQ